MFHVHRDLSINKLGPRDTYGYEDSTWEYGGYFLYDIHRLTWVFLLLFNSPLTDLESLMSHPCGSYETSPVPSIGPSMKQVNKQDVRKSLSDDVRSIISCSPIYTIPQNCGLSRLSTVRKSHLPERIRSPEKFPWSNREIYPFKNNNNNNKSRHVTLIVDGVWIVYRYRKGWVTRLIFAYNLKLYGRITPTKRRPTLSVNRLYFGYGINLSF